MVLSWTVSEIRRLICGKLPVFHTPVLFGANAPYVPLRISRRGSASENQSHGATLWWKLHDPSFNRSWLIHPCVGQTARRWRPQCNLTPPPRGTLAKICIHPIFSEARVSGLHFSRRQYGSICIRLAVVISQKCEVEQNFDKIRPFTSSRSPNVIDFGTNGKRTYEFLLVINSNYGPILHRFRDTTTYCYVIRHSLPPPIRCSM